MCQGVCWCQNHCELSIPLFNLPRYGGKESSFLRSKVLRDGFCFEFSTLICAYTRLSKLDNLWKESWFPFLNQKIGQERAGRAKVEKPSLELVLCMYEIVQSEMVSYREAFTSVFIGEHIYCNRKGVVLYFRNLLHFWNHIWIHWVSYLRYRIIWVT